MPDGTRWGYQYDPLGRRIEKSSGTAPGQTTRYIYDGANIVAILDGSNNPIAIFTHGTQPDEPLLIHRGDNSNYALHADAMGSIVAHTDMTGRLVERIEHSAYGVPIFIDLRDINNPIISSSSYIGSPFAFTGREFDPETSLLFYRSRYYDPTIGRFIQSDPIGFAGGINLYSYVKDNPVNLTDPSGCKNSVEDRQRCVDEYLRNSYWGPVNKIISIFGLVAPIFDKYAMYEAALAGAETVAVKGSIALELQLASGLARDQALKTAVEQSSRVGVYYGLGAAGSAIGWSRGLALAAAYFSKGALYLGTGLTIFASEAQAVAYAHCW